MFSKDTLDSLRDIKIWCQDRDNEVISTNIRSATESYDIENPTLEKAFSLCQAVTADTKLMGSSFLHTINLLSCITIVQNHSNLWQSNPRMIFKKIAEHSNLWYLKHVLELTLCNVEGSKFFHCENSRQYFNLIINAPKPYTAFSPQIIAYVMCMENIENAPEYLSSIHNHYIDLEKYNALYDRDPSVFHLKSRQDLLYGIGTINLFNNSAWRRFQTKFTQVDWVSLTSGEQKHALHVCLSNNLRDDRFFSNPNELTQNSLVEETKHRGSCIIS